VKLTINRDVDEDGENVVVFGNLRMSFHSDSHKTFYSKSSKDGLLRWLYTQTTGKPDDNLRKLPSWKEFYTAIGDEWGCSVAKMMPILQHAIYYHLVVPKMNAIKHVCFWKKAHKKQKIHVIGNYKSIEQVVKDGNSRLLPLMYKKNCYDTKVLKENYGSSLWKYLCSCKKHRISVIAKNINMQDDAWEYVHKIPTGLLDDAHPITYNTYVTEKEAVKIIDWVVGNIPYTKCDASKLISLLRDTVAMGRSLDKPLNFNKLKGHGYEDIITLHDKLAIEHRAKQDEIQSKRMDLVLCKGLPEIVEKDNITATLLDTRRKLSEEGNVMHHCVSSYASYVERGEYLVYSVRGNNERSTIGLQKVGDTFDIEQVRGVCNANVSESHKMFALHVLTELNKESI